MALVTTSQDPWQGETAVEGSLDVDALITGFKDLLLSLEQDRKLAGNSQESYILPMIPLQMWCRVIVRSCYTDRSIFMRNCWG